MASSSFNNYSDDELERARQEAEETVRAHLIRRFYEETDLTTAEIADIAHLSEDRVCKLVGRENSSAAPTV